MKTHLQTLLAVSVTATALIVGNAWAETKADYLSIKKTEVTVVGKKN